jgi:death-on-curing protein
VLLTARTVVAPRGHRWCRTDIRSGLIDLARLLVGDPHLIRDVGLLGAAAVRPQTTVFGQDAYPDLISKVAPLLRSVVNNHALVDGNNRLGWLATATFLER